MPVAVSTGGTAQWAKYQQQKVHKHSAVAVKNQQLVGAAQQSKLAALVKKTSLFYGELANH